MQVTHKQIFDILSYAVRSGDSQPVNVYYALMTDPGISTLTAYHMRKTRKQMTDAVELFSEQRDDILRRHGMCIQNEEIVAVEGETDAAILAATLAEIDALANITVDDVRPIHLSCLLEATGFAKELLVRYDALTVLEPLIENDVD